MGRSEHDISRLLATKPGARDAAWRTHASNACATCLESGQFTKAEALAVQLGPSHRRERDLARLGMKQPLQADAHPAAKLAEQILAGPVPTVTAGLKLSDPRRRAIELFWELQAGRVDAARSRIPHRLPGGPEKAHWRGLVHLAAGEDDDAAYHLLGTRGDPARWAEEHQGLRPPSLPAGRYNAALDAGDQCLAARLYEPAFGGDPEGSHVAAALCVCRTHEADTPRIIEKIGDPVTRAEVRVRAKLIPPGPGWESVARALEGSGWRDVAAPLAWLRAAAGWAEDGHPERGQAAIAAAGPRVSLFPAELATAHAKAAVRWPTEIELTKALLTVGAAGALRMVAANAPAALVGRLIGQVQVLLDSTRPEELLDSLATVDFPVEAPVWACILPWLPEEGPTAWLGKVFANVAPQDRSWLAAIVLSDPNTTDPVSLAITEDLALADPYVMAGVGVMLPVGEVLATTRRIDGAPPQRQAELRVALGEALAPRRDGSVAIPLQRLTNDQGPWGAYARHLLTSRASLPSPDEDPRITTARATGAPVFLASAPRGSVLSERLANLQPEADEIHARVDELLSLEDAGPRQTLSAEAKRKKKAERKAQKAARKAGRKKR